MLEHHGHLPPAEVGKLLRSVGRDVLALEQDPPAGRLHQPDQAAHQGRLAAAGESHDDVDLPGVHGEGDVAHRDNQVELFLDLAPALRSVGGLQGAIRLVPEHLPEPFDLQLTVVFPHVRTIHRLGVSASLAESGAACQSNTTAPIPSRNDSDARRRAITVVMRVRVWQIAAHSDSLNTNRAETAT